MKPKKKIKSIQKVRFSDVDFQNRIKPSAVLGYFQELAHEHAENLGVGYEELLAKGIAWVLSRIRLEFVNNMKWKEKFIIETWPQNPSRLNAERDFILAGENGKVFVRGISQWVVMDIHTRKLVPANTLQYNFTDCLTERAIENCKLKKIKIYGALIKECTREVHAGDIDMNGHMNNVKYLDYVYDCFRLNELINYAPKAIEINYLSEVSEGEKLVIRIFKIDDEKTLFSDGTLDSGISVFRTKIELK